MANNNVFNNSTGNPQTWICPDGVVSVIVQAWGAGGGGGGYSANGGTGSAKDYFMSSTYGKFAPDFVVVGPVTLPQNMAFYGGNDTSGSDKNPAQMIVDACKAADTAGPHCSAARQRHPRARSAHLHPRALHFQAVHHYRRGAKPDAA